MEIKSLVKITFISLNKKSFYKVTFTILNSLKVEYTQANYIITNVPHCILYFFRHNNMKNPPKNVIMKQSY